MYLQKMEIPTAKQPNCQLENQRPARTGPILVINHGPIQVAKTSNATETVLARAICVGV